MTNADYRYVDEASYRDVIDEFPDEHFDFVIVEGLFRDTAMLKSMPKLKRDGWLVLDNAIARGWAVERALGRRREEARVLEGDLDDQRRKRQRDLREAVAKVLASECAVHHYVAHRVRSYDESIERSEG